ncbi:hypothetical protein DXT63_06265 [Thermoanaerobacteraceae bacterium SP2]|nr:hypothetical protein DXT63_06265 [Thermoanaerobacteraceae bacterium SP2]
MALAIAVSAQGYGAEAAFDYRAEMTGHTVIKPSSGQEFLEMLSELCKKGGAIYIIKVFSHSYPRGLIMTNWSGFYDEPGPSDTKRAAYVSDLAARIQKGDILFAGGSQILLFGCDLAGNFSIKLSAATGGSVIASTGGTYPEIAGGRETGIFISTDRWEVYTAGSFSYSAGNRLRAW